MDKKVTLFESDLDENYIQIFTTFPIICQPKKVCSVEFSLETIDERAEDDLVRVSGCLNEICEGKKTI